jgi:hypothetical protein
MEDNGRKAAGSLIHAIYDYTQSGQETGRCTPWLGAGANRRLMPMSRSFDP